jgi:signal transduction histidine kinase
MTTNPSDYERQEMSWMSHSWHWLQTHGGTIALGILLGGLALRAAPETRGWERNRLEAVEPVKVSPVEPIRKAPRPERSSRKQLQWEGAAGLGVALLVVGVAMLVGRRFQADGRDSAFVPVPIPTPAFARKQFQAFALASTEGILLLDGLCLLGANSAAVELFGCTESQLRNRPVLELIDAQDHGRAAVQFKSGTDSTGEYTGVRADGSRFGVKIQYRQIWYEGRFIRALCLRKVADAQETNRFGSTEYRLKALEMERRRIARDIHDELGSTLTSIRLLCDDAALELTSLDPKEWTTERAKLRQISNLTQSLSAGLEGIVWTVRPENDSLESVASYLCRLAPDLLRVGGIRCRLSAPVLFPTRTVPAVVRRSLMLVVKESLHNVLKHSEAAVGELILRLEGDDLVVEVIDDGCGFDPVECADVGEGLANMRQRIQEAGGSLNIESQPGRGTKLSIRLHLPASEN